tara:strand:+ start:2294 stop:6379 length:4086 start_codon:yes stop_codon:yes gene_type:complete
MSENKNSVEHPGAYVKTNVIPQNLTVKDAAKLLGVGRPALSNFLNGKASLSANMAARLEKVFGTNQKKLLEMQSRFDAAQHTADKQPALSRGYMPTVVRTKAVDLSLWADNVAARSELPALLRRLVNSTGFDLTGVDFPAFDNAQRKGWDGYVEAGAPTQWIPNGKSGWEFGCDKKTPKSKAEGDYIARVGSVGAKERAQTTFVFVTPRNWQGKKEWASEKRALGDWKDVKAYDASDIEQWLEQSAPVQIWLAERLGKPTTGYRSLSQCWNSWAPAGDYTLSSCLFAPAISSYAEAFSRWLDREPGQPFIVAADSRDEALAFLSCLVASDKLSSRRSGDDAIVFDSADAVRQLSTASPDTFIAVADRPEIERELVPLFKKFHCIVVRPRNAVDADPDVSLDLLRSEDFEKALKDMGIEKDAADRLAQESARSPTILRRRLSHPGTTRTPEWAKETEMARKLVPAVLIGAWQTSSKADREIVSMLAESSYENFEAMLHRAIQCDDPPLWSVGHFRGVTSKIDALFAIATTITEKDLRDFLIAAEYVLSERDPALDLPEEDRWAAGMYGKVRDHSAALRSGVCETLVLLSVHGSTLFFDRLGFDAEGEINVLIRRLLSPLDLEKFHSQNNDLPNYAEAAPDVFLELVSNDLRSDNPVVMGLLKPVDNSLFGSSPARTGLLWGLENLAWDPANLPQVIDILARLCSREIDDNWENKPKESLKSVFRSWLPQTAASLEERIKALDYLVKRYSDVGWQICVAQFRGYPEVGHFNHRPKWRSDASGSGQTVTVGERNKFVLHAIELTLSWPNHNEKTLGDLLERLSVLSDEHQALVWGLVENWAENSASEDDKAKLREHIRKHTLSRRSRKQGISKENAASATALLDKLLPDDVVKRHGWLFASPWVEPSRQEYQDEDFDHQSRNKLIHDERLAALKEIWNARGFDGICDLLADSGAAFVVGGLMGEILKKPKATQEFILACLSNSAQALQPKLADCLQGLLRREDKSSQLSNIVDETKRTLGDGKTLKLFLSMPFNDITWRLLRSDSDESRKSYWEQVNAHWVDHSPEEIIEVVDRLLEVGRPAAAFNVLHLDWKKIETSRLKRLLHALVATNTEAMVRGSLSAYDISEAMAELNGRPGVNPDEMAQLEFIYLRVLRNSEHGIPNLEKQISATPSLYVQALAFAFKRSDEEQDLEEFQVAPERVADMARSAYELLDSVGRIPGAANDGNINADVLKDWLKDVRRQATDIARADIADDRIGQLLSKSPADEDGVWPCRAVCEAMEWMSSAKVGSGFVVGTHNSRGIYSRGEGGDQERDLANKYRNWSRKLEYEFPYVASVLNRIAGSYEREAEREDTDAKVRHRLPD